MARIYPLFSSSSGNSCFIGDPTGGILIDAGTSCRRLLGALRRCGIEPEAVRAIFITHDHSDHIAALRVLSKNLNVPVYASKGTVTYLVNSGSVSPSCRADAVDESGLEAAGFFVRAFHTPHDAVESVFYKVVTPDRKTCCVCTDLGYMPEEIFSELSGSDLVLLESNYDETMLRTGSYPYYLKQRIASKLGHLSNAESARTVKRLVAGGTRRIILGHLSRENNTPQTAEAAVLREMTGEFQRGVDYLLGIAPIETEGKGVAF